MSVPVRQFQASSGVPIFYPINTLGDIGHRGPATLGSQVLGVFLLLNWVQQAQLDHRDRRDFQDPLEPKVLLHVQEQQSQQVVLPL